MNMGEPIAGNFDTSAMTDIVNRAKLIEAEMKAEAATEAARRSRVKALVIATLKAFGTAIVTIAIAVTILAIPLKLVYLWGKFLWNLF